MTRTTDLKMRWMFAPDYRFAALIDGDGHDPDWAESDFRRVLRDRSRRGIIAEIGGLPAGFLVAEPQNGGVEILRLAVAPECRRFGIGRGLVERLLDTFRRERRFSAMVHERNLAAQLFFKAMGFRCLRTLPRPWPAESLYFMEYERK